MQVANAGEPLVFRPRKGSFVLRRRNLSRYVSQQALRTGVFLPWHLQRCQVLFMDYSSEWIVLGALGELLGRPPILLLRPLEARCRSALRMHRAAATTRLELLPQEEREVRQSHQRNRIVFWYLWDEFRQKPEAIVL